MYDSIMKRLRSGENALDIANEYADILNKTVADYEAEVEAKRKADEEANARKTAITNLTDAFNGFFNLTMPGLFGEDITEDMMSDVMDIITSAFNNGASGYTVRSHSVNGHKPEVKVTVHNDVDGRIAKFLEKNGLR